MSSTVQTAPPEGAPASGVVLPSVEDPVVAGLATSVGGRPGAHARLGERRFWTPVRWLVLLTLLTSLLGFWQKSPCRVHAWAEEYQYTRLCYTDVFALYFSERLNEGRTPYLEQPVAYPVGIGVVMEVASQVAEVFPADQRPRRFYDITWALLTACAVVVTITTARLAGRRRTWDAALFAASPALLLHGSTNWDLVAVALGLLGVLAWARRAPVAAGVLVGLGAATKLYPLLFLVPLVALAVRAGRVRAAVLTALSAVVTLTAVVVPLYLSSPSFVDTGSGATQVAGSPLDRFADEGLAALRPHVEAVSPTEIGSTVRGTNATWRFVEANYARGADWDSTWYALERVRGAEGTRLDAVLSAVLGPAPEAGAAPARLNLLVAVTMSAGMLGVVALALRAPRRPRVGQLLFLTAVVFCLTNKVFSPAYVVLLAPLAVLARPRWRPFLLWQATEVPVLAARFYFFISNDVPGQGIGVGWFLGAVLVRDLALLGYAALVVRDVLRPRQDVVRTDVLSGLPTGEDDPAGGVLLDPPPRPSPSRALVGTA